MKRQTTNSRDNQVHVMIAGTDINTVNRLASHLSVCGHSSEVTRNGLECVMALRGLIPDLLILEFGILWGGSAGVMAVMDSDPDFANVPVVLFAGGNQHPDFRKHPRIVASLIHPVQPHELSSLKGLLVKIASICDVARFPMKQMGQFASNLKGIPPHTGDGGSIRQAAFKVPSISETNGK